MGITVSIYLDERVKKRENFYPLKLRVTHDRKRYYLSIQANRINNLLKGNLEDYKYLGRESYSMEKAVFDKVMQTKPRGAFKEIQTIFRAFEMDYQKLADGLKPFTIEKFKEQFDQKRNVLQNDIFVQLSQKIDILKGENRFNSASAYESTKSALEGFHKRKTLSFDAISPNYLSRFNKWMLEDGKSETTAGIYLRSLRSIFNDTIGQGITSNYPFHNNQNKNGFKIPSSNGRKIALTSEELKKIFNQVLKPKDPGRFYIDSWRLLYLLQGMNPTDLCYLRYSNIQDGFIVFNRAKTKKSTLNMIKIPINEPIQTLLDQWGNIETSKNVFIWPVLSAATEENQFKSIKQFVKLTNKYMKLLSEELKLGKKVTTYVARHTYATQLMRYGAPVAFISKQLGHTSTSTTDNYLNSFEDDQLKDWQKKVTTF